MRREMAQIEVPNFFEIRTTEMLTEVVNKLEFTRLELRSINNILMNLDRELQQLKTKLRD